jgi:hypothetical protein
MGAIVRPWQNDPCGLLRVPAPGHEIGKRGTDPICHARPRSNSVPFESRDRREERVITPGRAALTVVQSMGCFSCLSLRGISGFLGCSVPSLLRGHSRRPQPPPTKVPLQPRNPPSRGRVGSWPCTRVGGTPASTSPAPLGCSLGLQSRGSCRCCSTIRGVNRPGVWMREWATPIGSANHSRFTASC